MEKFSTYEDIKNYIRTVAPSMIETNEEDDQGDYVQPEIEKEIEIDPEEDEKERLGLLEGIEIAATFSEIIGLWKVGGQSNANGYLL